MTDTERIDLDELDVAEDESEQSAPNRGDWLWEGDPEDRSDEASEDETERSGSALIESSDETTDADASDEPAVSQDETEEETDEPKTADAIPRVPRQNDDKPVGIPAERGGAGAGAGVSEEDSESAGQSGEPGAPTAGSAEAGAVGADSEQPPEPRPMSTADYHNADVDDMTMALTFNAAQRLVDPALAIAEARQWADWIGIVGDIPAHRINKFQRDNRIDADFFNGSGTDPGERLASIDHNSMFFAERLAVVGVAGEDESIAEEADWEFVPFSEAAEKADWELNSE
jgi:hypothetical protein